MGFKKVDVKTLEMKPFEKIGSEWMLISAANLWKGCPVVPRIGKLICNILRAFPEQLQNGFRETDAVIAYRENEGVRLFFAEKGDHALAEQG